MKCPHCGEEIDSIQSQGGHARASSLTKAQRKEIAEKAAAARWKGHTAKRRKKAKR
jgi:uncharacterized membrane protein YvbJ